MELFIIFFVLPGLALWYFLWDNKRIEKQKVEDQKKMEIENIEFCKKQYAKERNNITFESITPIPFETFEKDEMIYYHTPSFGFDSYIRIKTKNTNELLLYTIVTNQRLILFKSGGIISLKLNELSYYTDYERIVIIPKSDTHFGEINIKPSFNTLAKFDVTLKKFGVPYFFEETKEANSVQNEGKYIAISFQAT